MATFTEVNKYLSELPIGTYKLIDIVKNNLHNIDKYCNVSLGTVNRWIKNNKVPKQYTFELYKLAKIPIDY